jgi:hypothetical protein
MPSKRFPPTEEELLALALVLEAHLPLDQPLRMSHHTSMKGFQAVRVDGSTNGSPWSVDAYRGPYYYVLVPGFESLATDNLFTLVTTLMAMLGGSYDQQ